MPDLVVRRGADRAVSVGPGRRTAHSLSFGERFDPANLAFGALVALNDERVASGGGYPDHRHEDVAILTWVVAGALTHHSRQADGTVRPGRVQVQVAGPGIVHRETVAAGDPPTRFVQCWLRTEGDPPPSYAVRDVPLGPDWTLLADEVELRTSARAYAARLGGGGSEGRGLRLPDAPRLLLFVVGGELTLRAAGRVETLREGDDARLTRTGTSGPESRPQIRGEISGRAEVLAWALA